MNFQPFSFGVDCSARPVLVATSLFTALLPIVSTSSTAAEKTLDPVFVVASRFSGDPFNSPVGATIITAEQIRSAGVTNINEAIRKVGGVLGRQNLSGTTDAALDLRGFGTTSEQNMVIMVDGVRVSEIDLGIAMLSSIPVDSVDRIEIVRGGSSVMYGSGATGGTIQIFTKRAAANQQSGNLTVSAGSYNEKELRASLTKGWSNIAADINLSSMSADNYRQNNAIEQDNISTGIQYFTGGGRIGFRFDRARQQSGFPGSLTIAEFQNNPRIASTPNDYGIVESDRYTAFAQQRFGALDLAVDLSTRKQHSYANFINSGFVSESDSTADQLSPRLKYVTQFAGARNEIVSGVDIFRGQRQFVGSDPDKLNSRAWYVRDELRSERTTFAAGFRRELFDRVTFSGEQGFGLDAWDLQAAYDFRNGVNTYGKIGKSYRVANVDENVSAGVFLLPQTSRDIEIGTNLTAQHSKLTLSWFRHQLTNEIIFNPLVGALGSNVNLDPTTREGIEIKHRAELTEHLNLSTMVQHINVRFREGSMVGNELPLIASNVASMRLAWSKEKRQNAELAFQWIDSQRYGNDFSNSCAVRIPSFATFDARYAIRQGEWEIALIGNNLADRHYFSTAYGSCQNGIYPDPGRIVRLTVRRTF